MGETADDRKENEVANWWTMARLEAQSRDARLAGQFGSDALAPAAPEEVPPQSPLDFAESVFRDPAQPMALRASLAKAALPYVHGRWCPLGSDPRDAQVGSTRLAPRRELRRRTVAVRHARRLSPAHPASFLYELAAEDVRMAADSPAHRRRTLSSTRRGWRSKCGRDENEERALAGGADARGRATRARGRSASCARRKSARCGRGAPSRTRTARESAIETMLAQVKTDWPDIFDACGRRASAMR